MLNRHKQNRKSVVTFQVGDLVSLNVPKIGKISKNSKRTVEYRRLQWSKNIQYKSWSLNLLCQVKKITYIQNFCL